MSFGDIKTGTDICVSIDGTQIVLRFFFDQNLEEFF